MLSIDIRSLDSQAARVDAVLSRDDAVWEDDDVRPTDGVHVTGRLSRAGSDRYYFSGRLEGTVATQCRRCLEPVASGITDELHLIFAEPGAVGSEDPDVYAVSPTARELDLRPAVREQWLLAAPTLLLCREDCGGLCPRCGADLNEGPCGCPPDNDSRWNALRTLDERTR